MKNIYKNFIHYTLFVAAFGFSSFSMQAQHEGFKVIANKGLNQFSSNGIEKKLMVGSKIGLEDQITLSDASYVALVFSNGKSVELKTKGVYKASDLAKTITTGNISITKKYTDYVVSELTHVTDQKSHTQNMKVTGSVDRGTGGDLAAIRVIAPMRTNYLGNSLLLKWNKNALVETYVIEFRDLYDDVIFTSETTDTLMLVDFAKVGVHTKGSCVYTIYSKNKPEIKSLNHAIVLVDPLKDKEIVEGYTLMKSEAQEGVAIHHIVMASFCEQNKLYYDASKYYEKAIKLEPEVTEYSYMYKRFLNNIGIRESYGLTTLH